LKFTAYNKPFRTYNERGRFAAEMHDQRLSSIPVLSTGANLGSNGRGRSLMEIKRI